jgi:hypothetical protein
MASGKVNEWRIRCKLTAGAGRTLSSIAARHDRDRIAA